MDEETDDRGCERDEEMLPAMPCELPLKQACRFFREERDAELLAAGGLAICRAWLREALHGRRPRRPRPRPRRD